MSEKKGTWSIRNRWNWRNRRNRFLTYYVFESDLVRLVREKNAQNRFLTFLYRRENSCFWKVFGTFPTHFRKWRNRWFWCLNITFFSKCRQFYSSSKKHQRAFSDLYLPLVKWVFWRRFSNILEVCEIDVRQLFLRNGVQEWNVHLATKYILTALFFSPLLTCLWIN